MTNTMGFDVQFFQLRGSDVAKRDDFLAWKEIEESCEVPTNRWLAQTCWASDCSTNRDADQMNATGRHSTARIPPALGQA